MSHIQTPRAMPQINTLASSCPVDLCLFFVGTTCFFNPLPSVEERQRYGSYAILPPVVEAEGMDRQDLLLPGRQLNLIQVRRGGLLAVCWWANSVTLTLPPERIQCSSRSCSTIHNDTRPQLPNGTARPCCALPRRRWPSAPVR